MEALTEYVKNQVWLLEYPIRFEGMDLFGRMTLIRLENGDLLIHDPCKITDAIQQQIDDIGSVKYIVAPGSYHHLFVTDFQAKYPQAETFLCPGLERKRPDIPFDWILGNKPDPRWANEIDQVVVSGTKYMWEVVFFHKPSKTLILVDLLENIGDDYRHHTNWVLRFWWKFVFGMWNKPKPAPEYQIGWGNKKIVQTALNKILDWQAERAIIAHGETIEEGVNEVLSEAWKKVLKA
ncbi:hypothetical protein AVO42_07595 [Thiomicrospira sp. XS5]|uniref:DUF4336 domain-containing protein n=1 Tax=Thiomicrospira sp. XS5 TaxID=1775636 RepID=UPI000747F3E9|nr:DUF4336 domain-containing protein [Thiomicrospira sp. XS5]KUJ75205.1 hypothetical protein AVO42_07595 [Thiomicrospira sp. XS5]